MWSWIRKRLALRSYRTKLGRALVQRYGREPTYTVNQVRVTADKLGLETTWICYAYAEYCARDAFDAHHAAAGETCDWAGMRHETETSWGTGHRGDYESDHAHGYHDGHHHDDGGSHHDGGGHHH